MTDVNTNGDGGDAVPKVLAEKIIKQIEYYFGDVNLMKDKFLKEKVQEDDGWVTIKTLLTFNRLKQLTEDPKVIFEALKKSTNQIVEVNEEGEKIRRNPSKPLPGDTKERRDEITARSIYAKTFPLDVQLDDLMVFFEKYGSVENIFMKKDFHKKTFKGSVFVLFHNKDDAEKFIAEENTKYNDTEILVKMFKADYFKEKGRKGKGKKDGDNAQKGKEELEKEKEEEEEEKAKQQMTRNAVLHLKGMDPETTREEIKKFFSPHGDVGWVDFDKGVTEGYLRLKEPNSAAPTLEKAKAAGEGKIVIHNAELEVRVVDGDEELEYWKKMFKDIAEKQDKRKKGGGGRGGRGGGRNQRGGRNNRGGPQGKRRQNRKNDDEEDGDADGDEGPEAKLQKTD
ncbi:lupus La protein-like [Physella acuta]|uniref:lupus La protein-like n=1 Tax=Physella acuta TaxID=109671 RepID=UPI0027DBB24C|nr:lupus La protein-like [Physella acuta]XP_059139257.1 lupus La protein-like [Physella acuta]